MNRSRNFALALLVALAGAIPPQASAEIALPGVAGRFTVPVTSYRARRFLSVVRQQYDYSCGAASVATLLTYHFRTPTTEQEAFDAMYRAGDPERINREGFSLLEMKLYLDSIGFAADGFRVPLATVAEIGVPVIIMIEAQGYRHFVVLKGLRDGYALIGDPVLGLKRWKVAELEAVMATDVVLAIHNADEIGRRYFNAEGEWALLPRAPIGQAVDRRSLSAISAMLPGFSEF